MWWNRPQMPADEFCAKARTLGFARIELNHQVPPEALAELDLGHYHIGSLHDPCPAVIPNKTLERADQVITSLDEERRERAVDGVKNTILEAYNLGARHVVIHPGRIAGDHSMDDQLRELYRSGLKGTPQYEELRIRLMADRAERARPHLNQLIKSLWDIVTYADGKSLTIGLENRYHYYELPIFDELQVLLDEFQQPWVGWHYDVGHLQTLMELELTEEEPWFTQFGKRITGVHLHDVRGITDHQAPGMGEMDFKMIASALPPYCYRTVEVDKKVNMDDMAAGLELLAKSGCITQLSGGENHV
jgi:sugar phosphate isomerase/epimerase